MIGQALARAGTGGQDIGPSGLGDAYRLRLMLVQPKLPAPSIGRRLVGAEDLEALGMHDASTD
jgi:hypothetical protein